VKNEAKEVSFKIFPTWHNIRVRAQQWRAGD
jgi:hypothetical protein